MKRRQFGGSNLPQTILHFKSNVIFVIYPHNLTNLKKFKKISTVNQCFKYFFLSILRICNSGFHPLYGKQIVASVYGVLPFVMRDGSQAVLGGIAPDLLNIIAWHYNFKLVLRLSEIQYSFTNGTVGGALGEVSS